MTAPARTTVVNVRTAPSGSYVYVGRAVPPRFPASPWGNPWRVPRDGTVAEVLARYRAHVLASPELLALLPTLRGQVLGCWCAPFPCHGNVLAELADSLPAPGPFRVIVAGDRRMLPEHYPFVGEWLERILSRKMPAVTIIHGAQRGADTLGKRWAEERGLPAEAFPAAWKTHGYAAGPIRNRAMADTSEALVCFDGGGPGSASMLAIAREKGLTIRVVDVRHLVGPAP